jgi:hypothetical protein
MLAIINSLLTLATAAIHFNFFLAGDGIIYALNALGYLALLTLLYAPLPDRQNLRRSVRRALMGYAALTILAYIVFGLVRGEWTIPLGPVTKLIEVSLIGLLWLEDRQSESWSRTPRA